MAFFLAPFLRFRAVLDVSRRGWNHRVAGLVLACDDARVCGVKTVSLGDHCSWCSTFWTIAATVIAAAIALASAFTPAFAAFLALAFAANFIVCAWLTFTVAAVVLDRPIVLRRCASAHGRGHRRLIGKGQVLLYRVARNAVAAFWSLDAVTSALPTAFATGFAALVFAARLAVACRLAAAVGADFSVLAFLAAVFGASFRVAFTALTATVAAIATFTSFWPSFATVFRTALTRFTRLAGFTRGTGCVATAFAAVAPTASAITSAAV